MAAENVRLLLVRHGEAERRAATDELRPLSTHGRAEVGATAARLVAAGLVGPRIYASSLLRARQTADIIAGVLGSEAPLMLDGITPDDDPRRAARVLSPLCLPGMTPVVATHMPLIAGLIAWLEQGSLQHATPVVTAGAVLLEGEMVGPGLMKAVWRIAPGDD